MTKLRSLRSPFRPRAGSGVTALFLGGLAISAAVGFVTAPVSASAQAVSDRNDQPTPATVPGHDSAAANRPTGQVSPPKALSSTTSVVAANPKASTRTNPLDHLPAKDRAATGGTRRD